MNNRNGAFGGRNARELTDEIDRATEMTVAEGRADDATINTVIRSDSPELARPSNEQLHQMGAVVLMEDARRERSGGQTLERAERELAQDERELTNPLDGVGEESDVQQAEYRQADAEDLQNEMHEGLGFENRVMARSEDEVVHEVGATVSRIVAQPRFSPDEVVHLYRKGVNQMLGRAYNRSIGERNNAA